MILRAKQLNLTLEELDVLTVGEVFDLLTEESNDHYEYPVMATQEDIDRIFL